MALSIDWLGHASVKISGSKIIYIDPWKIEKSDPADIILISHDHYDHCSPNDIDKIRTEKTIILAPSSCAGMIKAKKITPGDKKEILGITIRVIPAYNINKQFHPRANNWVGYFLTMNEKTIYYPGDTDVIPEMDRLKPDIAFFPIGGTYTMSFQEAASLANKMMPQVAIPIHYGDIIGSSLDADNFKKQCKCKVEILKIK